MAQQYLSREEAQKNMMSRRWGEGSNEYRPKGYPCMTVEEGVFVTADDFLIIAEKQKRDAKEKYTPPTGKLGKAIDFIANTMKEGRVLATTIKQAGSEIGISIWTLWRALVSLVGRPNGADMWANCAKHFQHVCQTKMSGVPMPFLR